jgi:hypothetical protein
VSEQSNRGKNISTLLVKHLGQQTVLGVAIPMLKNHLEATKSGQIPEGLTEKQLRTGFRDTVAKFIRSEYHPTYIDRSLGPRGFLELSKGKYRIRQALLAGVRLDELEHLLEQLISSLRSAYEQRQAVIKKLEQACRLPGESIDERFALVDTYLSQITGNRGEMFEVVSFAVLREYFRIFGFSLQRFSTTHANDGGMDFVAGEAIYQVTTDQSMQKVRRDLRKAPGTKRVLVRPTASSEVLELSENEVLETIELRDLLNHFVAWLLARDTRSKKARHLQHVLEIALEEFRRENRAETA